MNASYGNKTRIPLTLETCLIPTTFLNRNLMMLPTEFSKLCIQFTTQIFLPSLSVLAILLPSVKWSGDLLDTVKLPNLEQ